MRHQQLALGEPEGPLFYVAPETTIAARTDVAIAAAEAHYKLGLCASLFAVEWNSAPNAGNMNRIVIFRDMLVPDMPLRALVTTSEEDLWARMAEQEGACAPALSLDLSRFCGAAGVCSGCFPFEGHRAFPAGG